jgi:hypothetical protein
LRRLAIGDEAKMKEHHDPWYVRLPDGRVVKAKSTSSVRHHVEAGNIPLNSRARRDSREEWVSLTRIAEFTDFGVNRSKRATSPIKDGASPQAVNANGSAEHVLKSGISARLDPMQLQTVGIRGLVDELIAAFDSTVSAGKLIVAAGIGAVTPVVALLIMRGALAVNLEGVWFAELAAGVTALLGLAMLTALLTRQTHLELSTMRPVRPSEAVEGVGRYVIQIFLGYLATIGVAVGLIVLLHKCPEWLRGLTDSSILAEILPTAAWSIGVVLAACLFALMTVSFLLPSILVVEECSLGDAFLEWRALVREHRVRVMVYEGMAIALALVAALPLLLPVQLALAFAPPFLSGGNWTTSTLPIILDGFAIGPAVAYMVVANLFIYLNLRYEFSPAK